MTEFEHKDLTTILYTMFKPRGKHRTYRQKEQLAKMFVRHWAIVHKTKATED